MIVELDSRHPLLPKTHSMDENEDFTDFKGGKLIFLQIKVFSMLV
jgi:hypothetical protein